MYSGTKFLNVGGGGKKKGKKYKSFPKSPARNASLSVWKRHLERCKDVIAYNQQVDKNLKEREKLMNEVQKIKSGGARKSK